MELLFTARLGLLLGDAVDVAAAVDNLASHDTDDFTVRISSLDILERLGVIGIAELRYKHCAVDGQEVEVARLESILGGTRQHALDGVNRAGLLLGHIYRGRRHNHLVDLELAATGIRRLGKRLIRLLALLVELMVGIIGPHAADLAGCTKACDVVHVPVGLKRVDAILDPNDLLDAQVLGKLLLDLLLGVLGGCGPH